MCLSKLAHGNLCHGRYWPIITKGYLFWTHRSSSWCLMSRTGSKAAHDRLTTSCLFIGTHEAALLHRLRAGINHNRWRTLRNRRLIDGWLLDHGGLIDNWLRHDILVCSSLLNHYGLLQLLLKLLWLLLLLLLWLLLKLLLWL